MEKTENRNREQESVSGRLEHHRPLSSGKTHCHAAVLSTNRGHYSAGDSHDQLAMDYSEAMIAPVTQWCSTCKKIKEIGLFSGVYAQLVLTASEMSVLVQAKLPAKPARKRNSIAT